MENLRFSSLKIDQLERKTGLQLMELVTSFNMSTLVSLVRKGLGVNEDEAYKAIDQYVEDSGKDTMEIQMEIINILEKQGFLAKKLALGEKISKGLDRVSKIEDPSEMSGEMERVRQSE